MELLRLVLPIEDYLDQVAAYRAEFMAVNGSLDGCGTLRQFENPGEWLAETRRYTSPDTVPQGKVQATLFLAVRCADDRLVGMIDVRHRLNEHLEQFGGHIGYSVRPLERRKGYAKEMLRLVLPYCGGLGLNKVLITCLAKNEASRRTILANGGVYENTVHEPSENQDMERYWITL